MYSWCPILELKRGAFGLSSKEHPFDSTAEELKMNLHELNGEQLLVILYGDPLKGFDLKGAAETGGKLSALFPARILGIKAMGVCQTLPTPVILLLPEVRRYV